MITHTAFQKNAFQNNAFQIATAVGTGGPRRFLLAQALARMRKPPKVSPTPAEVAAILTEARARLNFKPAPYVVTDLSAMAVQMRVKQRERELREFMDFVQELMDEQ